MGRRSSNSRGLTLVELLVVLVILVLVTAAAVPMMAPAIESRRLREATRGVSTYIMSARSRAIQIDRPVGIWIERLPNESGASLVLFQAEVPPPFGGFSTDSALRITGGGGNTITAEFGTGRTAASFQTNEQIPANLVRSGDTMQLNYQGLMYQIVPNDGDGDQLYESALLEVVEGQRNGALIPWQAGQIVPYQIFRQPARSSAPPYQLPEGIVIDLEASGLGTDSTHDDFIIGGVGVNPVVIMFAPSGALDRLYHDEEVAPGVFVLTIERFSAPVHLLIGRRERLPDLLGDYDDTDSAELQIEKHNWKDLESRWVSIGQQTGAVAASENAFVLDDLPEPDFSGDIDDRTRQGIARARRFAAEMRGTGGR